MPRPVSRFRNFSFFSLSVLRRSAAITAKNLPLHLGVVADLRGRGGFLAADYQRVQGL